MSGDTRLRPPRGLNRRRDGPGLVSTRASRYSELCQIVTFRDIWPSEV